MFSRPRRGVAAERQPVLAPVSAESGLVDDCVLAEIIEGYDGNAGMVLVTHLYGMVQSYPMTESAAQRAGWRILENVALQPQPFRQAVRALRHAWGCW
jgi:hypothetical protein